MLDEFDQYNQLDEMTALRNIVPSWEKSQLEPFLESHQGDVIPPIWNKLKLPERNFFDQGNGGTSGIEVTVTGCLNGSPAVGVALYASPPANF